MKTTLFILGLIALMAGVDYIGSILPWWVGLMIVLGGVGYLISIIVRIGLRLGK